MKRRPPGADARAGPRFEREEAEIAETTQHLPGTFCWVELGSIGQNATRSFYTELFGWSAHGQEMPTHTGLYTSFMLGEVPAGGMMAIQEDWGEMPPHWVTYFAIDNCDACVAKAQELGANVIAPPMDIPAVGRLAWLVDPHGATFAVIDLVER